MYEVLATIHCQVNEVEKPLHNFDAGNLPICQGINSKFTKAICLDVWG